ncbi:galectin-1-like [Trichosurus vulpecula]|uniref:galectin-1-like n=1 Tax=Trichosurus vulpecula TaxID=9337 RepID=UPI00186AF150|nr:galectin-1-like [Trichosurus vulpecula]
MAKVSVPGAPCPALVKAGPSTPSPLQIVFDQLPMFVNSLNLEPKSFIRIAGDILPNARRFTIDMGMGGPNLALHFNPRFNYHGSHNVIVCNSLHDGYYGTEIRQRHFPFSKGTKVEVCITFDGPFFLLRLPDGYEFTFPNRTEATVINYVGVRGDIVVRTLAFE